MPLAVVVSIPSVSERKPHPLSSSSRTVATSCGRLRPSRSSRRTTSVSPFRIQAQCLCKAGPVRACARGAVLEDPPASGGSERIELQPGILVQGRDACISCQQGVAPVRKMPAEPLCPDTGYGTGFANRNSGVFQVVIRWTGGCSLNDRFAEGRIAELVS